MHVENIVIGKPLIDPIILLSEDADDWNNNEREKTIFTQERFLPRILVEAGLTSSTSEIRRNRPELFKTLSDLNFLEIKLNKKKCWIIVGE